jgi:nitroimidazol reductase NimA-like FMN-containing flavoprotein (pyridoxamine 5'-phosphate oxidase superfamily)
MEERRAMEMDRNGLEVLDRSTCLQLLGGARLGRVGVTSGALPTILPINFRLVDDRIVFRTGAGSKLDAATNRSVVAFEVDEIDPVWHNGWSVVVTGLAHEVTDAHDRARLDAANIPYWAAAAGERVVGISTEMISGRRIVPARPPTRR